MPGVNPMSTWSQATILLAVFAALVILQGILLDETADERTLWNSGKAVVASQEWSLVETTFQGPIGLYGNQLLSGPSSFDSQAETFNDQQRTLARLGMVPFGLLAACLVFWTARRLFGDAGGLLALVAFTLQPLTVGYGSLIAVDMAHAAFTLLALSAVLAHAASPTWARRLWVGVAVGWAFATKYLALFLGPLATGFAVWHAVRAARERGADRRAQGLTAAGTAVVVAVAAVVAVHSAYLFAPGFAERDASIYRSDTIAGWIEVPGIGHLLGLLPAPMLRGIDYQFAMNAHVSEGYFAGEYAERHGLYHLVGILTKTPEVVLAAGLVVLVLLVPRWLRRGAPRPLRDATLVLGLAALVPFLYLSLVAKLQVGIRYVLPLYPIGCVFVGGVVTLPWLRARSERTRLNLLAAFLGGCVFSLWYAFPDGVGYYNVVSGGGATGWRRYHDSNSDWGQQQDLGYSTLLARHRGLERLQRFDGPRLGTLAIRVRFRLPRDPEDPSRARHWLDAFEPVDRVNAAWLCYEVTPEAWRPAAEADPRARADLTLALFGAGRLTEARDEMRLLPPDRRAPLEQLDRLIQAAEAADGDAAARPLAAAWLAAGRADLAIEVAKPLVDQDPSDPALWILAQAYARRGGVYRALRLFEGNRQALDRRPAGVLLLADLYRRAGRHAQAVEALETYLPRLDGEDRTRAEAALAEARERQADWEAYERSLGTSP